MVTWYHSPSTPARRLSAPSAGDAIGLRSLVVWALNSIAQENGCRETAARRRLDPRRSQVWALMRPIRDEAQDKGAANYGRFRVYPGHSNSAYRPTLSVAESFSRFLEKHVPENFCFEIEKAMTTAAISGSNSNRRADLLACIPHMRAFARVLTKDRERADDLVHAAIARTITAERDFKSEIDLKVEMFIFLHELHYAEFGGTGMGLLWRGDATSQEQDSLSGREANLDLGNFCWAFRQLGDSHREILILVGASGLSHGEIARVCGCPMDKIESLLSRARHELMMVLHRRQPDSTARNSSVLIGAASRRRSAQ